MKTLEELKANKKEVESIILNRVNQIQSEYKCRVENIFITAVQSPIEDRPPVIIDIQLNIKI